MSRRSRRPRDWGLRVVFVLGALLAAGGIYVYVVEVVDDSVDSYGPSMRPTLEGRAAIDVDSDAYAEASPELGDIVVAQAPEGVESGACGSVRRRGSPCPLPTDAYSTIRVLKRVVAGPGDRVAFAADGSLIRDGRAVDEPYIRGCRASCALPVAITVPQDHYFLAGDNRPASDDSRVWGPVAVGAIDGRVVSPDSG